MLAFPERPLKRKAREQVPTSPPPGGPVPSPAELKKFKELVDKNVEKDAEGNLIVKEEDKELQETAESFYGHYGYYPSFYPYHLYSGYYPGYYSGFYPGFYSGYYPYYGGYGGYPYYGYPYFG